MRAGPIRGRADRLRAAAEAVRHYEGLVAYRERFAESLAGDPGVAVEWYTGTSWEAYRHLARRLAPKFGPLLANLIDRCIDDARREANALLADAGAELLRAGE